MEHHKDNLMLMHDEILIAHYHLVQSQINVEPCEFHKRRFEQYSEEILDELVKRNTQGDILKEFFSRENKCVDK